MYMLLLPSLFVLICSCAMLGERAHHGEARPGIDEADDVKPERHAADRDHPDHDRRALDEVAQENGARAALVAPCVAREVVNEARDQEGGAENDAAEQGGPRVSEGAADQAEAVPSGLSPVVALGVLERIGEIVVAVMGEMGRAVDRIGEPQRQRPAADRLVYPAVASRMAVNGLVLEVQLPGDDPGADRGETPPRQVAVEIGGHEPRAVNDESKRHGRPLNVALKRRKFDDPHDLGPQPTRGKSPVSELDYRAKPCACKHYFPIKRET